MPTRNTVKWRSAAGAAVAVTLLLASTAQAQVAEGEKNDEQVESDSGAVLKDIRSGIVHSAFFGLSFDAGKGTAVGMGGAILETSDGGKTWTPSPSGTELALLAVDRAGEHTIIGGQLATMLVANGDGGWDKVDVGDYEGRFLSVSVNSSGLAFAGGEFGTVLKSTDGGRTWSDGAPNWAEYADPNTFGTAEPHAYAVHVTEAGVVTIAGEFGIIVRSEDGGETWTEVRELDPEAATLFSMHVEEAGGRAYAVGQEGELLRSADGGLTWTRQDTGAVDENFLGIAPGEDGTIVITGMRIMLTSKDNGETWTQVREGDAITDWYQTVRFEETTGRMVAVGHSGKIIEIRPN